MRINLALQGGGAHGAFTWGVLDRLLQEPDLEIVGVSGTSAGAMNAAALKCGWVENGAEGARQKLRDYWDAVSQFTPHADYEKEFFAFAGPFAGIWKENLSWFGLLPSLDQFESNWSPYTHNPYDFNALRDIVETFFDEKELRAPEGPRLFVNATNVRSGKIKIFKDEELSQQALLASAALPNLFRAVEIGEEAYWDGGYTGNPALFPLIDHTDCQDIVIVHINPIYREEIPKRIMDIENRVNEVSFNSALLRDLRQIDFIQRWMDKNMLPDEKFKSLHVHSIADDPLMNSLSAKSKIFANQSLIDELFAAGQSKADQFLCECQKDIGHRSSLDLRALFS